MVKSNAFVTYARLGIKIVTGTRVADKATVDFSLKKLSYFLGSQEENYCKDDNDQSWDEPTLIRVLAGF